MSALHHLFVLVAMNLAAAERTPLHELDRSTLDERLAGDARTVELDRQGLRSVIIYMDSRRDLFPVEPLKESRLLRREEKEAVWNAWQRFLDYLVALESVEQYHAQFHRLKGAAREDSFLIGYGAMLARYRAALEFISRADNNPELDKVLNDPVPELGLPGGTFARLKLKHLNLAIASQFAAREVLLKTFSDERQPTLRGDIRADADYVWQAGKGRGHLLTAKNALKIVQNGTGTAWLPVQTAVSEWMGHTKVYRENECLISRAQIREFQPMLKPGDVLLERREWYLSNIGLPGFWSHAALYNGTPAERRAFFDETEVRSWVKERGQASGDFEKLLVSACPAACLQSFMDNQLTEEKGKASSPETVPVRIIEAIGEGVSFKSLEHSAACDSLVVLRPRLPKTERALALLRAVRYAGRPYDFNFDFSTDSELVCTELVYKAYEPSAGCTGLKFPLVEMLGRKVTPANELAKQFDAQYETPEQQFDLVLFLDGRERDKKAIEASVVEFRQTWKRPKWHVLVQP
jgi:hypothetical protein